MSELFTFRRSATARPRDRFDLELVVDNFAGGGGASMGIERALGRAVDLAINHDPAAISMHEQNHPATRHLHSDIREVDPDKIIRRPIGLAWFSPDCTHFSRAKGSVPVSKKIRGLAWVVVRWARSKNPPRVIILENVREFQTWGPLGDDGKPCKARAGRTFKRWTRSIERAGYVVEFRMLNAADYGAPTHRRRLFMIARRDGEPICWPNPTHGPTGESNELQERPRRRDQEDRRGRPLPSKDVRQLVRGRSVDVTASEERVGGRQEESRRRYKSGETRRSEQEPLKPYRTAAECIDWSIPCPSIFTRKKPLAEKTLRRIALGIKRYVIDNPRPFIVPVTHQGDDRVHSIDEPLRTVTTAQRGEFSLVAPHISTYYGTSRDPNEVRGADVREPLRTQPTENRHALVSAFLAKHYGGVVGHGVEQPIGTVTSVDHHSVCAANLFHLNNNTNPTSPADPLHTVMSGGNHAAIAAANLIRMNHGEKQWNAVGDPLVTITGQGNKSGLVYAFLSKYFGTAIGANLNDPSPTSTSKHRFGLVEVNVDGEPHFIDDIGMRMLEPRELARAQGFPDDYLLPGPKYAQVAAIGNSVCPPIAEAIVRANFKPRTVKAGKVAAVKAGRELFGVEA